MIILRNKYYSSYTPPSIPSPNIKENREENNNRELNNKLAAGIFLGAGTGAAAGSVIGDPARDIIQRLSLKRSLGKKKYDDYIKTINIKDKAERVGASKKFYENLSNNNEWREGRDAFLKYYKKAINRGNIAKNTALIGLTTLGTLGGAYLAKKAYDNSKRNKSFSEKEDKDYINNLKKKEYKRGLAGSLVALGGAGIGGTVGYNSVSSKKYEQIFQDVMEKELGPVLNDYREKYIGHCTADFDTKHSRTLYEELGASAGKSKKDRISKGREIFNKIHEKIGKKQRKVEKNRGLIGAGLGLAAGAYLGKKHYDKKKKEIEEKIRRYKEASEDDRELMRKSLI